jgi:hypothetical protein
LYQFDFGLWLSFNNYKKYINISASVWKIDGERNEFIAEGISECKTEQAITVNIIVINHYYHGAENTNTT